LLPGDKSNIFFSTNSIGAGSGPYSAFWHRQAALAKSLFDDRRAFNIKVGANCPAGVADELVESSPEDILLSEKIDNFDIAETVLFLAGLGPYAVVHQVIVDHLGLNGHEAW
jgi:3-oxoacyl-[acyl-carrier protein] reductase